MSKHDNQRYVCTWLHVCDNRGMEEHATQSHEFDTPRAGVAPLNFGSVANPLGVPIQNFSKNHLTPTVSNTRSSDLLEGEKVPPGEYHPEYCKKMLEYFDKPKMIEIKDQYTWKSGAVSEKSRFVPAPLPHFSYFARSIGVSTRQLKAWRRKHEEFREAWDQCQEIVDEFLIDNGLVGGYGPVAMKFVAVNRTNMKDKQVHETRSIDMNKVLDQIAEGKVRPGGLLDEAELEDE